MTLKCALHGEVNPWEVTGTEAWFQWGPTTTLGRETPKQSVCTTGCGKTPVALSAAVIAGLRPNETYYYQVIGEDANVKSPEVVVSETVSFNTGLVAPQVVGAPSASFVKPFSAVMSGELNPENANTTFAFQYAHTGVFGSRTRRGARGGGGRMPRGARNERAAVERIRQGRRDG